MPTYEYHCDTCDKNFDVVQAFQDEPLTECPTCGSPVRKVFGSVGIVFKGSGFYKTDSRDGKSKAKGDKAEKATDGKAEAGSASTTGTADAGQSSANGKSSSSDGTGSGSSDKGGGSSEKKEKAGASSTGPPKTS